MCSEKINMEAYKIEWGETTGTFISDNNIEFVVSITHHPRFFGCECPECENITELVFLTDSNKDDLPTDLKVIRTMKGLIECRLDKVCNAVYFRCYNGDGHGEWRENLFNKFYDWYKSKLSFNVKMVEIIKDEDKYFLLINSDCPNSLEIEDNFRKKFNVCDCDKREISTDLTGDEYCMDSCGNYWLKANYDQEYARGNTCGC